MIYRGIFRDNSVGTANEYTVSFYTGLDIESPHSTPVEIQFTDDPFSVEYSGDTNNIYKPIRCSTATCNILASSYNQISDLIPQNATNGRIRCELKRNDNVEWVGYVTPNVYDQTYVRILEPMSIELQDALSTLQYEKINNDAEVITPLELLKQLISSILIDYQHLYITNTLQVNNSRSMSVFNSMTIQTSNFVDEDGEASDKLTVLEQLMSYLNLTIIPYNNSLYIINYDDVVSNRDNSEINFDHYAYVDGIWRSIAYPRRIVHTFDAKDNSFNTRLSTTSSYRSVSLDTDEYYLDHITPDLEDDYTSSNPSMLTFNNRHVVNSNGNYATETDILQSKLLNLNNDLYEEEYICYEHDILTRDEPTSFGRDNYYCDWSNTRISLPTSLSDRLNKVCVFPLEYNIYKDTASSGLTNYDGKRAYWFTGPQSFNGILTASVLRGRNNVALYTGATLGSTVKRPMLHIRTRKTSATNDEYLNIQGDWTFFGLDNQIPMTTGYHQTQNSSMLFQWTKISISDGTTTWYLNYSINPIAPILYNYSWSTSEQTGGSWVKLAIGRNEDNTDAYESKKPFKKTHTGIDGTCIKLPSGLQTGAITIDITFNRPMGLELTDTDRIYPATNTLLENFKLSLVDEYTIMSDLYKEEDNNHFEIADSTFSGFDDYKCDTQMLSSSISKIFNLATVRMDGSNITSANAVFNNVDAARGIEMVGIPEKLKINEIYYTYRFPNLVFSFDTHTPLHPYSRVKWSSQFDDQLFIVDSIKIDYKHRLYSYTTLKKRTISMQNVKVKSISKLIYRTGSLIRVEGFRGSRIELL